MTVRSTISVAWSTPLTRITATSGYRYDLAIATVFKWCTRRPPWDGARYLTTFLKGRLWRASTWSADLEGHVAASAEEITRLFRAEPAVSAVEQALSIRWRELHQADTDSDPLLEPGNRSAKELAGKAELMFNPSHQGRHRPAAALSDGQRSLLQLALTAATLDLESKIEQLDAPVTVATIAQRLRDDRGVDVSESTVRRYFATAFAEQHLEDKVTVPRGAVDPGSEA